MKTIQEQKQINEQIDESCPPNDRYSVPCSECPDLKDCPAVAAVRKAIGERRV